jgi:hypothetical protein
MGVASAARMSLLWLQRFKSRKPMLAVAAGALALQVFQCQPARYFMRGSAVTEEANISIYGPLQNNSV